MMAGGVSSGRTMNTFGTNQLAGCRCRKLQESPQGKSLTAKPMRPTPLMERLVGNPLAIDLCCGLGGWTEGLLAEGWQVRGYDIEAHEYGDDRYPAELIIRNVLEMHGSEIADADLIVASPPCQEYSYMAMPWSRAKQIAQALRGAGEFPVPYKGSRTTTDLNALFDACFRIQREASEAAGRYIPMVVENVRGAEPWVGRAAWNYGSYYLWGDLPALMPSTKGGQKFNPDGTAHGTGSWFAIADSKNRGAKNPGFRFDGSGRSSQSESVDRHVKVPTKGGGRRTDPGNGARFTSRDGGVERQREARKAASAMIAKIPLALSSHIARIYKPKAEAA